jgi:chromosome segregation ATPase
MDAVRVVIARIEQLERERDGARKANREMVLEVLAASGQAQEAYEAQLKAEAKVEQLERERDYTEGTNEVLRGENQRLEATVAKVEALMKAERDAAIGALEESGRKRGETKALLDKAVVALRDALDAWDNHNKTGDMMQGYWVDDARAVLAEVGFNMCPASC